MINTNTAEFKGLRNPTVVENMNNNVNLPIGTNSAFKVIRSAEQM